MTKFYTVWTPKRIADFVTEGAVREGGRICEEHQREGDALSDAFKLNQQTAGSLGYYCVMVKEINNVQTPTKQL